MQNQLTKEKNFEVRINTADDPESTSTEVINGEEIKKTYGIFRDLIKFDDFEQLSIVWGLQEITVKRLH